VVGLATALRYNQFGGAVGDRSSRTKIWFFNYEGVRNRTPSNVLTTVPTSLQRQGDFSKTLDASGRQIAIFDPSVRPNPSQAGDSCVPSIGNVMPASAINLPRVTS
jgi:hypothetical protein